MPDNDEPVDGAEPRPQALVEALEEIQEGDENVDRDAPWPELGPPGGIGATNSVADRPASQDPNAPADGGRHGS